MMSAVVGGKGGSPKEDVVREIEQVLILLIFIPMTEKGWGLLNLTFGRRHLCIATFAG